MEFLSDIKFGLLSVGVAVSSILILGSVVFFNNRRSITHRTFLMLAVFTGLWSIANFAIHQFNSPTVVIWILRVSVLFATWHAFSFFQFFYVFPKEHISFPKWYTFGILPAVVLVSILVLTPFVFAGVSGFSPEGKVMTVANGPAIGMFGSLVMILALGSLFLLGKHLNSSRGVERVQFRYILVGSLLTFPLLIIFNFIYPALLNITEFVPLGAVFMLPFIVATAYATVKHHLFDVKVIATEILAFVLAIIALFEILFVQELWAFLFRILVFLLVLVFGILLIRSVRKEVHQREQLQKLTEKLAFANQNLVKLDKAKTEFVSIASHQLRTPLTAIKGYMSLMLEGSYGKVTKKLEEPMKKIYDSNERLIQLVNDLLNISRIQSGKTDMEWGEVDIEKLVEEVLEELQVKAKEKKVHLKLQKLKDSFPMISADREKIRNVLLNIVDNGIRYTERGGITVSADRTDGHVLIEIKDTGEGMSKEELDSLFESFTRGKAGQRMWTEGTGLGLYIAKQFVTMHKGKIWASSAGKGKGSTFFIELPIKQKQNAQSAPAPKTDPQREGSHV